MSIQANDPMKTLREKFPNMRPLTTPPSLFRVNGIGVSVYGRRDPDEETGTYIKTLCICFLFIPLIPLAAYRVADAANGGWYFLGKERLSGFAKKWNLVLLCAALVGGLNLAWAIHTSSPDYRARKELARADQAFKAGHILEAARIYQGIAVGAVRSAEARDGLKRALDQCLASDNAGLIAPALAIAAALPSSLNSPTPLVPDVLKRGLDFAAQLRSRNPEGALTVLKAVEPLDPKGLQTRPLRIELLKEIIVAQPDNVASAVELALIYELGEQLSDAVKVLRPLREKLGSTEGARILGQQLLQEGKNEESYGLLHPYVQVRLKKLQTIETAYTNALAQSQSRAIEHLRKGKADRSFYDSYKNASKAEQANLVDSFLEQWMKTDAQIARVSKDLVQANQIVHVTLDLGIVQLGRAQNLQDPAARKSELEAAEKTFLAIRSFAGNTDEYRMFLGQVYYWLGKSPEGRKLFDELLASRKRAFRLLLSLAETLRLVGEYQQARELCEEAYGKGADEKQKWEAASMRAHCQKDLDDQIAWLEKCNPQDPVTQVELNNALGQRVLAKGDRPRATEYFRQAISGYDHLPKGSATLNNQGLACLNLYEVSGDLRDHTRGLKLLEEAVALDPGNSILLENTARCLIGRAYLDLVQGSLRLNALKEDPDSSMLAHLYHDDTSRAQVYQRLRENEHMKKALSYLDKALLLAPKNVGLYVTVAQLHGAFRDLGELQKLQQRAKAAALDASSDRMDWKAYYSGAKDKEQLDQLRGSLAKMEELLRLPEIQQHPLTLERVKSRIVGTHHAIAMLGGDVDAVAQLTLARELQSAQPSGVAQYTLISALLFKAHTDLKASNPAYAAIAGKTRHSLSAQELLTLTLERGGATAAAIRTDPLVREAVGVMIAVNKRFPSSPQSSEWALIREFDKAAADDLAARFKASPFARLADDLTMHLRPMKASAVLDEHWDLELDGDQAKAAAILADAATRGVPLP